MKIKTLITWLSLLLVAGIANAFQMGESDYGFNFPSGFFYSNTRGGYGSAGLMIGKYHSGRGKDIPSPLVGPGILIDATLGRNDYSYSFGYGFGFDPIGLFGGAIRTTVLVGKPSDTGYFLERNQKAYGIEGSFGLLLGARIGVFRIEKTHATKVLASIGIGF
ncbi:MAG: hypothetical protein IPN90_01850 [Elusimicrobia bacterium]|nr:hypothetical protein [Elusimicrobiota bacterium]